MKERILEISFKEKLSHLGSVLTALPAIEAIYDVKKPDERFVLSSGHAALALYVVLESKGLVNAEDAFHHHGVHPDRCDQCHIDCSTGSLGQGLPIAVGMALADRSKNVYCLISDGECAEGSIWEALRIGSENNLKNLRLVINANGWGAYQKIDIDKLVERIRSFGWATIRAGRHKDVGIEEALELIPLAPTCIVVKTDVNQYPFLKDQGAHYYSMSEEDYNGTLKT